MDDWVATASLGGLYIAIVFGHVLSFGTKST